MAILLAGTAAQAQTAPAPAPAPRASAQPSRAPEVVDGPREFTNAQGQKIKAEIINYRAGEVFLKREDGQTFRVAATVFSPEDQAYIRAWALRDASKRGDIFSFSATSATSGATTARTESDTTRTWMEFYKMKMQNKSQLDFTDLRVDYIIFKRNAAIAASSSSAGTVMRTQGSTKIANLKTNGVFEFETVKVSMDKNSLNPGWSYASGGRATAADDLLGVWVRVYSGSQMLQEWCTSVELMRKEKW